MKKIFSVLLFSLISTVLFAQNEVGNDGDKLIWILVVVLAMVVFFIFFGSRKKSLTINPGSLFKRQKVRVELEKDRVYYPDRLRLKIKNTGNTDLDIDRPFLIFDRFWIKRNFRINGSNNRTFYPLYLEKGKIHTLDIELFRFYGHDKNLKKFPKVKVRIQDVKGKTLGQKAVFLRKTLIRF